MNIASLGISVDTSEAGRGSRDLDDLASSAQRAQKHADSLRQATENANRSQADANTIARRAAAALGERSTSSESLLRAELALARALQARANAEARVLARSSTTSEADLAAARAVAALASQRTDAARVAVLEFTAMERAAAAQESASAAAAELSSRYDLLSSKFNEGHRAARLMDAALEDLAEAERLGVQITGGASNAIDQIILKYDAQARSAAELRAELDRLRATEALAASSADGQARYGPAALSGKSARDSASVFESQAREMEALQAQAMRLRSVIDPLGTAQDRYNQEIAEFNMMAQKGVISARELAQAHALSAQRLHNYRAVMNGGMETTSSGRQANLANVVAQFQDIGVTAQMGMSPLTIALQQGTQLSQALLMMEDPLKGIGKAFLAMLSPLSLMTIAMVALAAVAIQFVDWPVVGAAALRGLGAALQATAPYVAAFAATLALIYSPKIIMGIVEVIAWISRMGVAGLAAGVKMAMGWALANPAGAILAGIALIITGLVLFRDDIAKIFGRDIVGDIQNAANYIIGAFVGAFKGIQKIWNTLPAVFGDIVFSAVNGVLAGVEAMLNGVTDTINGWKKGLGIDFVADIGRVDLPEVQNPYAGAAGTAISAIADEVAEAQKFDYVGAAIEGVGHFADFASGALNDLADSLGKNDKAAEKAAKKYAAIVREAKQFIEAQKLEAASLGMTTEAINRLKYEQDLLNKAADAGLKLSPKQRAELAMLAAEMARVEEQTRSLTEWYNLGKSVFGSFLADMRSDLMSGKSIWESFANAAINALDTIAEKMLSMAANGIFDMLFGALMGGLSGGFGSIAGGAAIPSSGFIPGLTGPRLFASGGYTGNSAESMAAGIVHGKEYVLNAQATRNIGVANLNAMNAGYMPANQNSGGIVIHNQINVPPGTTADVAPAIAREVTRELRRQLPDAIKQHDKNPLRRTG